MQAPGQAPVKTIGLHQHPEILFPFTGLPAETGGPGPGGSAVNVALPAGTGDASWLRAFHAIVPPLLRRFRPQILVIAAGLSPVVPASLVMGALKSPWVLPPGVRRVLDPVAVLAMGGDAADAAPGGAVRLGSVRAAAAAGAPRPGLALGDDRRRRRRLLHRLRLRQLDAPGAAQASCTPAPRCARSCWRKTTATMAPAPRIVLT